MRNGDAAGAQEVDLRGRRFITEADIERHIRNGFGQGSGAGYVPWLRVQDVPSKGRSRKVPGAKIDRPHHFFSDLEHNSFLVLEFSDNVVDIREQFPLLPRDQAQAIANSLGIRYPRYPRTTLPYVMTTDFVVTVQQPDGTEKLFARTVKYKKDIIGPDSKRTLEKFDIEREFWSKQNVDWNIITEEGFNLSLVQNLGFIRKYAKLPSGLLKSELIKQFLIELDGYAGFPWSLSQVLKHIGTKMYVPYQDLKSLFFHLIWDKSIVLDLRSGFIEMGGQIPEIRIRHKEDAAVEDQRAV